MGLYDYLTEYENLDELNHLAHLISELDSDEIETLEAALNKGDHISVSWMRESLGNCCRKKSSHSLGTLCIYISPILIPISG